MKPSTHPNRTMNTDLPCEIVLLGSVLLMLISLLFALWQALP
jgi:hypothetical protein